MLRTGCTCLPCGCQSSGLQAGVENIVRSHNKVLHIPARQGLLETSTDQCSRTVKFSTVLIICERKTPEMPNENQPNSFEMQTSLSA